jgi:uncharacterized protein
MHKRFYEAGLRFSCQRCSLCCRRDPGYVFLSELDVSRLVSWAGSAREAFIVRYCRWVSCGDEVEYLCLKEKPNYDCLLWSDGCLAYEHRPLQCSTYPFWPRLLADEDAWKENAMDCPGIDVGQLHGYEEIERQLRRRVEEPIITRQKP